MQSGQSDSKEVALPAKDGMAEQFLAFVSLLLAIHLHRVLPELPFGHLRREVENRQSKSH